MNTRHRTIFHPALGLVLVALLSACGSDDSGQTVRVNLSLIVNSQQAQKGPASRMFAWLERWFPGATPAWAQQAVTDIASIQVQITGPGISTAATTTVPISNPTSGQVIPVDIQAPVGANRTITVTAFNAQSPARKIFGGTKTGVNLIPGPTIPIEITLVRLFTVTVQKEGDGSGTVTSSPPGIDCGQTCENQFQEGLPVFFNAPAAEGSTFAGWSGGCSGTGSCSVTVTSNTTVTARFNVVIATDQLTVNIGGAGTVTSDPSGISCPGTCAGNFATGTTVRLTAAPINGSTFFSWNGGGCSNINPCDVAMTGQDQTVTATFSPAPSSFTLTVTVNGAGTVTSNPSGISCPGTCSAGFAPSTPVTLTATPATGSTFSGDCSGAGSCSVLMDANRSVTATFSPPATLTITKMGSGTGTVTSSPGGIDCGTVCSAPFPMNSSVTLIANPASGSVFIGWSGGGCVADNPCTTVNTGQTVVATFDLAPVTLTVSTSGPGDGTVTSDQGGISCPSACTASFTRGTTLTLTATSNGNSIFVGWRGGPCDAFGVLPCAITMNDNNAVDARFERFGS